MGVRGCVWVGYEPGRTSPLLLAALVRERAGEVDAALHLASAAVEAALLNPVIRASARLVVGRCLGLQGKVQEGLEALKLAEAEDASKMPFLAAHAAYEAAKLEANVLGGAAATAGARSRLLSLVGSMLSPARELVPLLVPRGVQRAELLAEALAADGQGSPRGKRAGAP